MDLVEGIETCLALSLPSRSSTFSQGSEAHTVVSSTLGEAPVLQLSRSEELDIVSVDAGDVEDSPPHSPAFEELVEVGLALLPD